MEATMTILVTFLLYVVLYLAVVFAVRRWARSSDQPSK